MKSNNDPNHLMKISRRTFLNGALSAAIAVTFITGCEKKDGR